MGDAELKKDYYRGRTISCEVAQEFISQGYFAIDAHCHSSFSFDVPDSKQTYPENVAAKQINMGLRPILTDHDNLNGYNFLKSRGVKIIPAVELTIKPVKANLIKFDRPIHTLHINIYGLGNADFKVLSKIASKGDLDALVEYMRTRNLDWLYNHPFWHERNERLNWRVIPELAKHYFDVIEVNGGQTKAINDLTIKMAKKHNKGIIATTDTHTANPGWAYTIAKGRNFKEFWSNVKSGNAFIVRGDMTISTAVRETKHTIEQIFGSNVNSEASRKFTPDFGTGFLDKFARLVTSGNLKHRQILKKIIAMLLHTINYFAGPLIAWRFYLHRKNADIESIYNNFSNILRESAAKQKKSRKATRKTKTLASRHAA